MRTAYRAPFAHPRRSLRAVLALLSASSLLCGLGTARAALPTDGVDDHGVRFAGGFPVTDPSRIYRLSEVERGQVGVGYTVFSGAEPEPFEVEVLGVMEGMLGPGEDVVLTRLIGANIEHTGVISGMSGSPVYFDGRLLGAVAYRFGSFSKEPIAGITPIERMLPLLERPEGARASATRAPPLRLGPDLGRADRGDSAVIGAELLADLGARLRGGASSDATLIATPVAASGLHPAAAGRLGAALEAAGFSAAGLGRGPDRGPNRATSAGKVPAAPILPGAPIAALLSKGDVNLSAIGTVTFVDGSRVLGFGHPFVGHGTVAFPMATAAILNTLASPAGSYKQGLAAREVGVVSQDRLTAIGGRLGGDFAPLIPLDVEVYDEGASTPERTHVDIVDSAVWLPTLTDTVISSAALRRLSGEAGGTVEMTVGYEVDGYYLEIRDAYAAPAPTQVAAYASRDAAILLAVISRNELGDARISKVRAKLRVWPEVRSTELEWARVAPSRARPGETVTVTAGLKPFRGPMKVVKTELVVPSGAPPGKAEIFVGGGLQLDRRDIQARGNLYPRSIPELLGVLADRRPAQAVYARMYLPQDGLRWGTETLTALPPSLRAAVGSQPSLDVEATDEHPGPQAKVELSAVVSGGRKVSVEILPALAPSSQQP